MELIGQYSPQDVFTFDESALFYRLLPNKTLATLTRGGAKAGKERMTTAFCCNLTGSEKMQPVIIGKAALPLSFRKVQIDSVPFHYFHNKTAWQNRGTFSGRLRKFDLKTSGRKVLLLLDNASSHYVAYKCRHVKINFLPPSMTSKVQPLEVSY